MAAVTPHLDVPVLSRPLVRAAAGGTAEPRGVCVAGRPAPHVPFPHSAHRYSRTLSCTRMCSFSMSFLAKDFPHCSQAWLFTPYKQTYPNSKPVRSHLWFRHKGRDGEGRRPLQLEARSHPFPRTWSCWRGRERPGWGRIRRPGQEKRGQKHALRDHW